jgi:hypothetical protein
MEVENGRKILNFEMVAVICLNCDFFDFFDWDMIFYRNAHDPNRV